MKHTLLKGGTVINASGTQQMDVLIGGEKILAVGAGLDSEAENTVDVSGKYLLPGLVDSHTHLDMPTSGTRTIDDFESGTLAALAGGTTTIIDFALQQSGSLIEGLDSWHAKAKDRALIDYGFHVAITDASDRAIDEIQELVDRGVTSFKIFMAFKGAFQADDGQLLRVLRRTLETGGLVQVHAENGDAIELLIQERLKAGYKSPMDHALSRPAILEAEATHRAIEIARFAERPIFFVHVSSSEAEQAIHAAKQNDLPVYGETCTHYLTLTLDDVARPGSEGAKYVCSPPLRTVEDQEALWRSLRNGILEVCTTDHCAFSTEQKALGKDDFSKMPNGLPTIQYRLALLYDKGVVEGRISMNELVRITSTAPARMFGLDHKGSIAPGYDADIVIFDPNGATNLSSHGGFSRSDYSVFEGWVTKGAIDSVLSRGELVFANGKPYAKPGRGRFIERSLGPFTPGPIVRTVA